ncbi:MAG: hypothetical protein ACRD3E_19225, partial [Terriglobales bacterium]
GKVCGDTGAHGSSAQDSDLLDSFHFLMSLRLCGRSRAGMPFTANELYQSRGCFRCARMRARRKKITPKNLRGALY